MGKATQKILEEALASLEESAANFEEILENIEQKVDGRHTAVLEEQPKTTEIRTLCNQIEEDRKDAKEREDLLFRLSRGLIAANGN